MDYSNRGRSSLSIRTFWQPGTVSTVGGHRCHLLPSAARALIISTAGKDPTCEDSLGLGSQEVTSVGIMVTGSMNVIIGTEFCRHTSNEYLRVYNCTSYIYKETYIH